MCALRRPRGSLLALWKEFCTTEQAEICGYTLVFEENSRAGGKLTHFLRYVWRWRHYRHRRVLRNSQPNCNLAARLARSPITLHSVSLSTLVCPHLLNSTTSSSISTLSGLFLTQENRVLMTQSPCWYPHLRLCFSLAAPLVHDGNYKDCFLREIIEELLWSVKGRTDSTLLLKKGVIGTVFLEKQGLGYRRTGDLLLPRLGSNWLSLQVGSCV